MKVEQLIEILQGFDKHYEITVTTPDHKYENGDIDSFDIQSCQKMYDCDSGLATLVLFSE